jgi:DNA-binding NarL/FixJ family response regulator
MQSRYPHQRIFMLSSQPLFSQGVESLLAERGGLEIVGRETDAAKALACIRKSRPDVVIADSRDIASAPFSIVACLLKEDEHVKILVLNLEDQTVRVYRGEMREALNVDDLVDAIANESSPKP